MPLGIGATEIIIVLIIVLVIFGPKRLPDLGRSLGRGMREFKDSVTGNDKDELPESTEVRTTKVTSTTVEADQPDPAATATESKP